MHAKVGLIVASLITGAALTLAGTQLLARPTALRISAPGIEQMDDQAMFDMVRQLRDSPRQPVVVRMESEPIRVEVSPVRIEAPPVRIQMPDRPLRAEVDVQVDTEPIEVDVPPLEANVGIGLEGGLGLGELGLGGGLGTEGGQGLDGILAALFATDADAPALSDGCQRVRCVFTDSLLGAEFPGLLRGDGPRRR